MCHQSGCAYSEVIAAHAMKTVAYYSTRAKKADCLTGVRKEKQQQSAIVYAVSIPPEVTNI